MSKVTGFATAVAVSFSWLAVSCMGPIFVHPPVAAAPAVVAAAQTPGVGTLPVGMLTPLNGGGTFLGISVLMFVLLGACLFVFRGKAPENA